MARSDRKYRGQEAIAGALYYQRFLSRREAREAAFHVTDWRADLAVLERLLDAEEPDPRRLQEAILAFVAHASAHLAAAHRIVMGTPVTDVFELGAVKGKGRARRKAGLASRHTDPT